jgi:hypothetical protein
MKYSPRAILAALKLIAAQKVEQPAPEPLFFSEDELMSLKLVDDMARDALGMETAPVEQFYRNAFGHEYILHGIYIGVTEGPEDPCGAIASSSTNEEFAKSSEEFEAVVRNAAKAALMTPHGLVQMAAVGQGKEWPDFPGVLGVATVYECHGDMRRVKQWGFRLSSTKPVGGCAVCKAPNPKKVSYETFEATKLFPFLGHIYDAGGDFIPLPPEKRREGLEAAVRAATGHLN